MNIYHTLLLHSLLVFDPPLSFNQKIDFYRKSIYRINGDSYSLLDIEHGVLRANMTKASIYGNVTFNYFYYFLLFFLFFL